MKVTDPRPIDPAIIAEVAQMLTGGCDLNEAISRMRVLGLYKVDCIKLIREHSGMSLGKAKDIIHLSPAWADRYESDEAFHDSAEQALNAVLAEDKLTAA